MGTELEKEKEEEKKKKKKKTEKKWREEEGEGHAEGECKPQAWDLLSLSAEPAPAAFPLVLADRWRPVHPGLCVMHS